MEIGGGLFFSRGYNLDVGVRPTGRPTSFDVLMVAGGGAAGVTIGAGGGAGGVLLGSFAIPSSGSYTITIGAGASTGADGTNGSNTTCFGLVANGGGGGYGYTNTNGANPGNPGGSGAGGAGNRGGTSAGGAATQTSQSTLIGYGFAGGLGTSSGDPIQPGGGGGAGAVGQAGQPTGTTKAGDGGDGIYNNYRTGSNVGYAGGGSGHSYNSGADPTNKRSTFGGGVSTTNELSPGVPNTGGGGAGGGFLYGPAQGSGGSGIVVIRYPTFTSNIATGGNVTYYTLNNVEYTVHTFTSSNTLVIV
jgi:hypothetical protein